MSSLRDYIERVTRRTSEIDFRMEVSMGRHEGFRTRLLIGNTCLQNISDGEKTVWDQDTTLVRLFSDTGLFISSTNSSDIGISLIVVSMNELYETNSTIVVLNGQTQVPIGVDGILINVMNVIGPTTPLGDIYAATSTPLTGGKPTDTSTIQSKIIAGKNATHNGYMMVPKGFSAIVMNSRGNTNSVNKVANLINRVTPVGGVPVTTVEYSVGLVALNFDFLPPIGITDFFGELVTPFPEGTFIEILATVDSNSTNVLFGIDLMLARSAMLGIIN